MGSADSPVLALDSPQEYFRELIREAMANQKTNTSEEAEYYLVNLLNNFIDSNHLFDEPLALMLGRALQAHHHHKIQILKHLGDITLYVSGFFPESVHRKVMSIDYYINMGGRAYHTISSLSQKETFSLLFEELSEKFVPLVDVLSEVSDKSMLKVNSNILQLYELWLNTGSERVEQILQEQGITPHRAPGLKTIQ
jgi:hypothetical protein